MHYFILSFVAVAIVVISVHTHIDLLSSAVFSNYSQKRWWPPESYHSGFFVLKDPLTTPSIRRRVEGPFSLSFHINKHAPVMTRMWLPVSGCEIEPFVVTWCINIQTHGKKNLPSITCRCIMHTYCSSHFRSLLCICSVINALWNIINKLVTR